MPLPQDSNISASLRDYRLTVEREYCHVIVQALENGREDLHVKTLITEILPKTKRDMLDQQVSRYHLNSHQAFTVEMEVCHRLLYYLKEVKHIRNQKIVLVGAALLEHECDQLGLTYNSANAINAVLLSHLPPILPEINVQPLTKYDQHLRRAIYKEGILSEETKAELRLLQLVLEIPDSEIPPPEKLQSDRKVDYIPLWRSLKDSQWKEANQETYRCLLLASIQPERDTQPIDVDRLSLKDLQTIDSLWREFSNGRFGFSAQFRIWQTVQSDLEQLGKELDWQRNNSWINEDCADFSLNAVKGHLPLLPHIGWWHWVGGMVALLNKVGKLKQDPDSGEGPDSSALKTVELLPRNTNSGNRKRS